MGQRQLVLIVAEPSKRDIARQFGGAAAAYARSAPHASGPDLPALLDMLELRTDMRVLDVATGPGHTALAIAERVQEVVGVDIAGGMVEQARELAAERGIDNVAFFVMDAERLNFADSAFDVVTCRIAAHHFLDVTRTLTEMARVLRPGGLLGLVDNYVPDDPVLDAFLNTLERLRDPVHVRALNLAEWRATLEAAGFSIEEMRFDRRTHEIEPWLARTGVEEARREDTRRHLMDAPRAAREHYRIKYAAGRPISYTDDKVITRAVKVT